MTSLEHMTCLVDYDVCNMFLLTLPKNIYIITLPQQYHRVVTITHNVTLHCINQLTRCFHVMLRHVSSITTTAFNSLTLNHTCKQIHKQANMCCV